MNTWLRRKHIAARDPGNPSAFWVNPFGMSFSQVRVSDLILVDHNGNLLEGKRPVNTAAFCIHSEVHRARADVVAAAHTHSVHGKAFSSLGIPLDPITQDVCAFYDDHGLFADYSGVVNDTEEGRRIGVALGDAVVCHRRAMAGDSDAKAVILRNHGLLTVGASVAEAAWYFITMERSCQAQLLAMAAWRAHLDRPRNSADGAGADLRPAGRLVPVPALWDQITKGEPDLFD